MATMLLVRHGQASWFEENYDRLSSVGEAQSRLLGELWAGRGMEVTRVFTGPRLRQVRSAELCGEAYSASGRHWPAPVVLEDFDEQLQHEKHDDTAAFIFLAASLMGDPAEADDIASVIERSSNMRCVRGERLSGDNVQLAIVDLIRRAAVMIADVSDDHRNTLIEAGIAMGGGTRLKLMSRRPPADAPLKKRFMFEGQEYFWFQSPEERLGLFYYFARQFHRRVYVLR